MINDESEKKEKSFDISVCLSVEFIVNSETPEDIFENFSNTYKDLDEIKYLSEHGKPSFHKTSVNYPYNLYGEIPENTKKYKVHIFREAIIEVEKEFGYELDIDDNGDPISYSNISKQEVIKLFLEKNSVKEFIDNHMKLDESNEYEEDDLAAYMIILPNYEKFVPYEMIGVEGKDRGLFGRYEIRKPRKP